MTYRYLGRSGLRVSPLAFGTGTFGAAWGQGWSIDKAEAEAIFNAFLDGGMNHIDTADVYQAGESETWTGEFMKARGGRDRVLIATKYTMGMDPTNPNGGGNGRARMIPAVDQSLRRLQTDHIDLLYAHHWDTHTPVEEVLRGFDDLIRAGKVRYAGLSNFPGWYLGQADVLTRWHGWAPVAAIQMEYNLLERTVEDEYLPFAERTGTGLLAWSPLANGLLTGRYAIDPVARTLSGAGRVTGTFVTDPFIDPFAPETATTLDVLRVIAGELEVSPAQTALAWLLHRPGLTGVVTGASNVAQVMSNLAAAEIRLSADQLARLDKASARRPRNPYGFHRGDVQAAIRGEDAVFAKSDEAA